MPGRSPDKLMETISASKRPMVLRFLLLVRTVTGPVSTTGPSPRPISVALNSDSKVSSSSFIFPASAAWEPPDILLNQISARA